MPDPTELTALLREKRACTMTAPFLPYLRAWLAPNGTVTFQVQSLCMVDFFDRMSAV